MDVFAFYTILHMILCNPTLHTFSHKGLLPTGSNTYWLHESIVFLSSTTAVASGPSKNESCANCCLRYLRTRRQHGAPPPRGQ